MSGWLAVIHDVVLPLLMLAALFVWVGLMVKLMTLMGRDQA